jgi:hypothetical protein
MNRWQRLRTLIAYLAPDPSLVSARKHIAVIVALLGVAAIGGAVVLTPSRHHSKPGALDALHQRMANRAKIDLFDDFSQGLEGWQTPGNGTNTWSYDKNGFVNPGALSLFGPSQQLKDYNLDALVQVDSKGDLGLVFRASSSQDYQVAKLGISGSGPMSTLTVSRYTVLAGHASKPTTIRYPERLASDTLYRVHLEVRDEAFALYIQGNLVDFWSDPRLASGGVGLFSSASSRARVGWIRVTHNADTVGEICSFLSAVV